MEEYLNKGIKEVISKFPKVADILNEYNIGCVPCSAGSCLLKDVVEIHNLPAEEEQELMLKIAGVIYPDRKIELPKIQRKPVEKFKEIKYTPPMKKLVDEHLLIKRLLALIPELVETVDIESESGRELILGTVDFIRSYADKFHHAKEEEILFKYADENHDIIKTMLEDHTTARSHVKAILKGIEGGDKDAVIEHLNGYKELLTEHIKKEDEILYPWLDRNLSITKVGELFTKFNEADEKAGNSAPKKCREFIEKAEEEVKAEKREEAVR
jgi:hemerythrin-like domain-containing protein